MDISQPEIFGENHLREASFTVADLVEAIDSSNFDRGIGADGFDGRILKKNAKLKTKVAHDIGDLLNRGELPDYINTGRFIPLSKRKG